METNNFEIAADIELLTPAILEDITRAVKLAYDHTNETHTHEYGDDKFSYGTTLWRYVSKEIKSGLSYHLDTLRISEKNNRLKIQIGNLSIGFNKIGYSGKEDINKSFPNNMNNVFEMATNQESQLSFFDMELEEEKVEAEVTKLKNIIIGHMGNSEDGLCALYLCFPILEKEEKIVKWAHTIKIWDLDSPEASEPPKDVELAPVEELETTVLTLKELQEGASLDD